MDTFRIAFSTMELNAKIPPGDAMWPKFNGSFENYEARLPAVAWMIDEGRAFTTWHSNGWRHSKNYVCGQHLGLDFDTEDERSSIPFLLRDDFIARYGALVYATPSSKPDAPRSRVLFVLDAPIMQAANYARAASALIWLFGGHADRQCKDAARFFYGSVGSMPTHIDNVLPLDTIKALIAKQDAMSKPQPQRQAATLPAGDDGKALAGSLRFAADASEGQRNTSLYWAARRWAERNVPQSAAETMAVQVARSNGLEDAEAYSVVRSAYRVTR